MGFLNWIFGVPKDEDEYTWSKGTTAAIGLEDTVEPPKTEAEKTLEQSEANKKAAEANLVEKQKEFDKLKKEKEEELSKLPLRYVVPDLCRGKLVYRYYEHCLYEKTPRIDASRFSIGTPLSYWVMEGVCCITVCDLMEADTLEQLLDDIKSYYGTYKKDIVVLNRDEKGEIIWP